MPESKYRPLYEFLNSLDERERQMSFAEIERIISAPLPPSARTYNAWWSNEIWGEFRQSRAWLDAGWETRHLDIGAESVQFIRC